MKLPLRSWKNLLGNLGLKIVERKAAISRRTLHRHRHFESLEDRRMMAIDTVYNASLNTLLISSDSASDSVTVGSVFDNGINAYAVTINGSTVTSGGSAVAAASLSHLFVYGNDGNDTLDLSAVSSAQFNSSLQIILDGGAGADTIKGSQLADRITGGTGNDSLTGNAGNDTYVFDPAVGNLGTDTITEVGGAAVDTLDFSAFNAAVAVDLSVTTTQTVSSGTLSLQLSNNTGLENVIGGSGNDTITGNIRDNVLAGGAGDDTLSGGSGNDTLLGQAGNDSLAGGLGSDTLDGGIGDDSLSGDGGNDTYRFSITDSNLGTDSITEAANADSDTLDFSSFTTDVTIDLGLTSSQTILSGALVLSLSSSTGLENAKTGSGNDTLVGNSRDNVLTGNGGNDWFEGKAGNDTLTGGSGNDFYKYDPSLGNLGSDIISEGNSADTDTLDFSSFTTGFTVNIGTSSIQTVSAGILTLTFTSGTGLENVYSGTGDDIITGNGRDNLLIGGDGNDTIAGGTGHDTLRGQAGNDTLTGGTGNDMLDGGTGDDSLSGESGSDTFVFNAADGNLGTDTIAETANLDSDTLDFGSFTTALTIDLSSTSSQTISSGVLVLTLSTSTGIENAVGGAGNDSLTGNTRDNTLTGGAGDDALAGGTGNDTYRFDPAVGNLGTDTLTEAASSGTETLDFSPFITGVVVDLGSTATQAVSSGILSLILSSSTNFENATGGSGNDILTGNSSNNILIGNAGDDTLSGLGNNDKLTGGAGNDSLQGGTGIDTYYFSGSTSLGSDTVVENANEGTDIIDMIGLGSGATLNLGTTSTQTVNSLLSLTLSSAVGIETLIGTNYDDTLTGNSLINIISGNGGNDIIDGGDGNDQLDGGAGNDTVSGGAGNDKLIGGGGDDTLAGGTGDDLYSFSGTSNLGSDIIGENPGEGNDTADLSQAIGTAALNVAFGASQVLSANLTLQVQGGENLEYATPSAAGDSGDDTFTVGGYPGTYVPVVFTYIDSLASYLNEVYVYVVGQESSTAEQLFTSNSDSIGTTVTRTYAAGTVLSLYIVQHGGVLGSIARKFYTDLTRNLDNQDHVRTTDSVAGEVVYNWEDLSQNQPNPNNQNYDGDFNDVVVSVVTPKIDIDVDSDNDGAIELDNNGDDDPIEENDPGQVIAWNNDDDDENDITDFRQEASVAGENDLVEVLLSNNFSSILAEEGMRLKLSSPNDNIRVYLSADKTGLLNLANGKLWKLDSTDEPPAKVYVEGIKFGKATLNLELVDGENNVIEYDTVVLHVVGADLDGDSNNDGTIDPNNFPATPFVQVDDEIEEAAPGVLVGINYDDDDGNGVADIVQAGPIVAENDLVQLKIDYLVPPGDDRTYELVLSTEDTDKIKVYKKQDKSGHLDLTTEQRITVTGAATDLKEIWVEGIAPGTATITLQFYQSGGATLTTDKVVLTVVGPKVDLAVDSDNNGTVEPVIDDNKEMNGIGAVVFVNSDNDNGNVHVQDITVAGIIVAEDDLRPVVIDVGILLNLANLPGWSLKLKHDLANKLNFYADDKRAIPFVDNDGITLNPAAFFGGPKTIYVEGKDIGLVTLTLELKGPGNFILTDQVEVRVLKVDADVDSDNMNQQFSGPTALPSADSDQEENLEMSTEDHRVGKYIPANHDDTDEDGIGDFHDTEVNAFNNGFTPLVVNFGPLDLQKFPNAKFKIEYPHYPKENEINNDELYADQELDANDYEQQLSGTNTALRIWRKDETAIRKAKDIKQNDQDKGDIVNFTEPTWYTASELGLSMDNDGNLKGILYIEGLHDTNAPSEINVTLDFDRGNDVPTTDPGDFSDKLLVKVARIDMDIDSDNTQDDLALPELKPSEDILEAHINKPGKIIYSNILNQDGDNQLDFEDPQVVVNGDLKFGFTPIQITFPADMHNAQVRFGFEAGGVSGGFLTPGVRLWTKQIDQFRNASSIALDGDLIPNGEWFDVSKFDLEVSENSEHPTRWVILYVEGMGATLDAQNESRPTPITVEIDPVIRAGNGPNEHLGIFDTVMVTVTSADIDVDSDNTTRYGLPERNSTEEQIEHLKNDPQRPGKYVLLNQRNTDNDGFLDSIDDQINGGFFTPIVIQKPKSPAHAGDSGSGSEDAALIPDYRFQLKYRETYLRLWNADAYADRVRDSVSANGNIVNSDTSYSWAELGGIEGQDTLTLYVEGLEISPAVVDEKLQGQEAIKLEVYEYSTSEDGEEGSGGSGSTQLVAYDEVIVNVVNEVSVAIINKYAMEPNDPQKAWELKDPAEFRISRGTGNTSGALTVYFQVYLDSDDRRIASLSDYGAPKLNRTTDVTQVPNTSYYRVDIPEGQYFVDISFFPNQDSQAEWDEEIRLNLVQNPEYFVEMDIDQSLQNVPYNDPVPNKPFYYLAGQPPYGSNPNQDYPNQVSAFIIDANSDIAFPLNRNRDIESTGLTPAMQSNGTVAVGLQSGDVTFVLPLAPGGWGPTYNSDDNLRPLLPIQIDIPYSGTPSEISVKLNVGGVENEEDITFTPGANGFPAGGSEYNFMVMAQESLASKLTSGHYDYFATFNIKVGGETYTRTIRGKTEIVNRVDNALGMTDFGKRWWPEMLDRMIPTDGVNAINTSSTQDLSRTQQGLAAYFGQTLVRGDNTTAFYHGYNPVAPSEINDYNEFTSFLYPSETDEELFWRTGLQLSSAGLQADEDQASWALSGLEGDKQYQIFVTWEPGLDRASNAAYTMSGLREVGNTYSEDKTIIVNQKFTPGELLKNGKSWRLLGTYVATGTAEVILKTNSVVGGFADGLVHAGEVMVVSDWTYETPDGSYNYLNQGEMDGNTNGYYKGLSGQTSDDLTLLAKTGTRYTFDEFGFLTLVQDRNENQTKFAYTDFEDANDDGADKRLLETVTSQGGLVTHYLFEEEHLDKILDFAGRETDYDIVGGLLEAIHEPSTATNSPVTNFAYFGQSEDYQLQTVTNARDDKTEIEYDSIAHRAKKITNPDSVGNPHSAQTIDGSIIFGERAWQVRPEFVSSLTSETAAKVFNEANGDLADNTDEPVTKYTDARNNVWRYQLDQFGGVIFSSDPVNGPGVVWKTERREKDGLAKKYTEPAGGGGIDSLGALVTSYDYDERGNLNELIYADNTQESWQYNQQFAVLAQSTDQLSRVTTYGLDSRGNVNTITINSNSYAGDGASSLTVRNSTEYTPTPNAIGNLAGGLVTLITQPSAAGGTVQTKYEYYDQSGETNIGLVHYAHQAFGTGIQQTTTYTYDPNANLHEVIDYRGNTTVFTYDELDRLTKHEAPDGLAGEGSVTNYQYDSLGNLLSSQIEGLVAKKFAYDGMGRLIREYYYNTILQNDLTTAAYAHDAIGNVVDKKTLVTSNAWAFDHFVYDARGLLTDTYIASPETGEVMMSAPVLHATYDVLGNLASQTTNRFTSLVLGSYVLDPTGSGIVSNYAYDELGRTIKQVINANDTGKSQQTRTYYNPDGQIRLVRGQGHDSSDTDTNYTYDDFGRTIEVALPDPDGPTSLLIFNLLPRPTTKYEYYQDGSLKRESVQGEAARSIDYTYDELGRLKSKTLPLPGDGSTTIRSSWNYEYQVDYGSLIVTITDPRSNTATTVYDANDRVYRTIGAYDNQGMRAETTNEYYAFGGLKESVTPVTNQLGGTTTNRTVSFTYDDLGNVLTSTDFNGTSRYERDQIGQVLNYFRYEDAQTIRPTVHYDYDYAGNVIREDHPNDTLQSGGTTTQTAYDTNGNVTQKRESGPGAGLLETYYTYDAFDRLSTTQDHLNQLTTNEYYRSGDLKSSTKNNLTTEFTVDYLGRTTKVVTPNGDISRTKYDNYGNVERFTDPAGNDTKYEYDALNRKVAEKTNVQRSYSSPIIEATRTWLYDRNNNVLEYKNRDDEKQIFEYDANNRLVEETWAGVIHESAEGYLATWTYNEAGELLQGKDVRGDNLQSSSVISDYFYAYRPDGRLVSTESRNDFGSISLTGAWFYGYDQRGNRISAEYSDNYNGDYTLKTYYDRQNRPIYVEQYDHTSGSLESTKLKSQTIAFGYTSSGFMEAWLGYSEIANTGPANLNLGDATIKGKYGFWANGQLQSLTYEGPTRTNPYNSNRIISNYSFSYAPNRPDLIFSKTVTSQNGFAYNPTIQEGLSFKDVQTKHYYDNNGQLESTETTVSNGAASISGSTYKSNGRRSDATYGADNRLFFDGTSYFEYDLEGRRSERKKVTNTVTIDDEDTSFSVNDGSLPGAPGAFDSSTEQTNIVTAINNDQRLIAGVDKLYRYTTPDSWTVAGDLPTGHYRVETTWTTLAYEGATTDADIVVYALNNTNFTKTELARRSIDQSKNPLHQIQESGFYARYIGESQWQGTVVKVSGDYDVLHVEIQNKSDGILIGDAVKIERLGEDDLYFYDPRNRLVEVSKRVNDSSTQMGNYSYDIFDRLITSGSGTVQSLTQTRTRVYDGQNVVVLYDQSNGGTVQTTYQLWQPNAADRLLSISELDGEIPTVKFVITDQVGTVQRTFDGTTLGELQDTGSFGLLASSWTETFGGQAFAGQEFDPFTGLQYSRARWYDANTQIFISQDPMGFAAGDTNLYRRAGNDPVNFTDSSGHFSESIYDDIAGGIDWVGKKTGLDAWSAFDTADRFVAGVANVSSFGYSNQWREQMYGDIATRNHQGLAYNAGTLVGIGLSLMLGRATGFAASSPTAYAGLAGWNRTLAQAVTYGAQGYAVAGDIIGVTQSIAALNDGSFNWTHTFGFLPSIGWSATLTRAYKGGSQSLYAASFINESSRSTHQWGINWFRTSKIRSYMRQSEEGRMALNAIDEGRVNLQLVASKNVPDLYGESFGSIGGSVPESFVYLLNTQNGRKFNLLGESVGGYQHTAATALHETLHGMGIAGSARAEALVRLAELKLHGIPTSRLAIRQVLSDMRGAGIYGKRIQRPDGTLGRTIWNQGWSKGIENSEFSVRF